jgi:hypothetical protein
LRIKEFFTDLASTFSKSILENDTNNFPNKNLEYHSKPIKNCINTIAIIVIII